MRSLCAALVLSVAACARRDAVVPVAGVVTVSPPSRVAPIVETKVEPADDSSDWITPCKEGTPEYAAAATELGAVSSAIDALPAVGDPAPIAERLTKLVGTPCLAGIDISDEGTTFSSALSLKTFWSDGGEAALEARLAWDKPGDRRFWLTPSIRSSLTKETAPAHPLLPLLCSAAQKGCGSETAGWALRATTAFHAHALAERASFVDQSPIGEAPKTHASCMKVAASAPADQAFVEFAECMRQTPIREDALPLGTFHAPTSGWVVLRGRRGHHGWCNELRAYDLATGSAYIASMCGAMSFMPQPAVTGITVEQGKLPVDALREAAWMMFLAEMADHSVVVSGAGQFIPPEIQIRIPANQGFGISLGGFGTSSGRTTLVYQWIRSGKSIATGTINWPDAYYAADEHATQLLAIAEAGMTKGCAPAALPAIPWNARNEKSARVGDPEAYFPAYDEPEYEQLERALARVTRCSSP